jgi:hypothetical protein
MGDYSTLPAPEPRVFFRADCFYIIDIPPGTEADNAHCNPGTIRIEDMRGNVLWKAGETQ